MIVETGIRQRWATMNRASLPKTTVKILPPESDNGDVPYGRPGSDLLLTRDQWALYDTDQARLAALHAYRTRPVNQATVPAVPGQSWRFIGSALTSPGERQAEWARINRLMADMRELDDRCGR